jgi:hypothetical protein
MVEDRLRAVLKIMVSLQNRSCGRNFVGCGPSLFVVYEYFVLSHTRTYECDSSIHVNQVTVAKIP